MEGATIDNFLKKMQVLIDKVGLLKKDTSKWLMSFGIGKSPWPSIFLCPCIHDSVCIWLIYRALTTWVVLVDGISVF